MVLKSINCLLADGTTTKIDIGFYHIFKKYNWNCSNHGYIATTVKINGKKTNLFLHHLVLNFKYDPNIDLVADHKFGNISDNRSKKLRTVSHFINSLNKRREDSNTGYPHIYYDENNSRYRVQYTNMFKSRDYENFPFIEGENEVEKFFEAFEFFENIKQTLPHYREAFCLDDNCSSSGESVDEVDYKHRVNIDRLNHNNTSEYKNISDEKTRSCWKVYYCNEEGKRTSKVFRYKPKSNDTKEEAFLKAIKFRDEHNNNRSITKKKTTNNTTESYCERMDIDIQRKLNESGSDSETISMSYEEIREWQLTGYHDNYNHTFRLK
jgi:hypothetical protein